MTHDFAKKPKAAAPKKKTAPKSQVPAWVWLLTGIVAGVFISFLGYLADITPEPKAAETTEKVVAKKPEAAAKADSTKSTTRFDFYTLLPEREVIVPTEKEESGASSEPEMVYILQAGSFRSLEDADRLRAKLILMGFDAHLEAVNVNNNDVWHRVQVGPFTSRSVLAKARGTLISNGIEAMLLKRKAGA
jgi:cell division protein FtsN